MVWRSGLLAAGLMAVALAPMPGVAQQPFVAPEFYSRTRPDFGERLPLCVMPSSPTLELDRLVGEAIADTLFLEPEIVALDVNVDGLDEEGIWPDVLVHLSERCVGLLGSRLVAGFGYPDWLFPSAPYFTAPYVLVSSGGYRSLAELPDGSVIGSPIYTRIDSDLLAYISTGAVPGARRLPYDRPELLERFLADGTFDAAIVWAPHLSGEGAIDAALYDHVGSVEPLSGATESLGIVMLQSDAALRAVFDEAIATLGDRPEITSLMAQERGDTF